MGILDWFTGGKPSNKNKDLPGSNSEIKNGLHKTFHDNGNVWTECNFKNGEPHGIEKQYYDNNKILCEQHWKDGKLNGPNKHYDKDGNLILDDNYKNGLWDGECKKYENGVLKETINFKDGKMDGPMTTHTQFGTLESFHLYESNELQYKYTYYFNQSIHRGDEFKKGILVRSFMNYDTVTDIYTGKKDDKGNRIMEKGQPLGEEMIYDENGEKKYYIQYYINEEMKEKTEFKNGKLINKKCWDEKGNEVECQN